MSSPSRREPAATPRTPDMLLAIIGAGIGGLGTAIHFQRAGYSDYTIFERADDIGGTWYTNRYPDVAVDIPGIVYQFSFEKYPGWTRTFPKGAEVRDYLRALAEKYRLRDHIRLSTEVMRRDWDEDNHLWVLTLDDGSTVTARFVITATGAFVEPRVPDIPGLDDFTGTVVQTQRWDEDFDPTGKRIAVIGTGATAIQLVPQLAKSAAQLDVYQRRAIWVFAKPDFAIPAAVRSAFKTLPLLQSTIRGLVAALVEVGLVGITIYGKQIAPLARVPAWACRAYLFTQVRERELRQKLTPAYGFGCKRPSVSNIYYKTFTRENVALVTDPIECVTPSGIRTRDGVHRDVDVLVLATGFEMSNSPVVYRQRPVNGRDGFDLATFYETQRAAAYEGVSMPGLPNTFMVFGPYAWSGSSWHVMVENAARHALRVIEEAGRRGATAVEISQPANERFHRFVDERGSETLMHGRACVDANSYYIDRNGDFSFLRPTTAYQSTRASKTFDLDDYLYDSLDTASARASTQRASTALG